MPNFPIYAIPHGNPTAPNLGKNIDRCIKKEYRQLMSNTVAAYSLLFISSTIKTKVQSSQSEQPI